MVLSQTSLPGAGLVAITLSSRYSTTPRVGATRVVGGDLARIVEALVQIGITEALTTGESLRIDLDSLIDRATAILGTRKPHPAERFEAGESP